MCFATAKKIATHRYFIAAIAVFSVLTFSGCDKIKQGDVGRVQTGMSIDEVHKILGAPHSSSSGQVGDYFGVSDTWRTPTMIITVQYLNGEVKLKTIEMRSTQ